MRRLRTVAVMFVSLFVLAQLIRPGRANSPIDPAHALKPDAATPAAVVSIIDRSCGDCHSNRAPGGWHTQVAPVSWLMASTVTKGRAVANFSEWSAYSREQQRSILEASCSDARAGTMPGIYAQVRPETRLSPADIDAICRAAQSAEASR